MHLLACLTLALGFGTTTALAQPTALSTGTPKTKVQAKGGGRGAKQPAARPAATDWSVPYAARLTPAALRPDLEVLASDAYEGRATGKRGQQLAATYLARAFAAAGLAGPVASSDNPYYQPFPLKQTGLDPTSSITIGGRTFVVNRDFYVALRDPVAGVGLVQPTFVGYGISTAGYADFTPGDPSLQAKNLLLLLGEPLTPAGQPLLGQAGQASAYGGAGFTEMVVRSPMLRTLAPRATFRILPSRAAFARVAQDYPNLATGEGPLAFPDDPAETTLAGPNVFFVSPEMGAALLGTTPAGLAAYEQAVAAAGKPVASPFKPAPLALHITNQTRTFTTENVLGYLEGTDRKDEVVIVSAHYDHIGVQNGVVYNGADDDGSGTAAVLAMARVFAQAKKDGHGPRRSLLFLQHVGEEKGLLGSRYYTEHPVFPLASTVADLHLDMVGRVDSLHQGRGNYLYLVGADWLSRDLRALSETTNRRYSPLALDYQYSTIADPAHLYYRSDHYNFARHGVPIIFYTSGLHADYHQPTDDVAQLDFAQLARRTQLIFHTAWAVANRNQRPAVDAEHRPTGYVAAAPDLDRCVGTYASTQLSLKISVRRDGAGLRAQPSAQYPLPLEAVRPGVFKADQAGVRLEFAPDRASFILRQSGQQFLFTRQAPPAG